MGDAKWLARPNSLPKARDGQGKILLRAPAVLVADSEVDQSRCVFLLRCLLKPPEPGGGICRCAFALLQHPAEAILGPRFARLGREAAKSERFRQILRDSLGTAAQ